MTALAHALLCPFCSSTCLTVTAWMDDDGEYDAIECTACKAAAPADVWNTRNGIKHDYGNHPDPQDRPR